MTYGNFEFDRRGLIDCVIKQFKVRRDGFHGQNLWARVRRHGLAVGRLAGADLAVVELFALLHDSQRRNEDDDPLHGARAAVYAVSLQGSYFTLETARLEQLAFAIRHHSDGKRHKDPTIQTCWDADRLDLGRVGIKPSARYLSAQAAGFIEDAYRWSLASGDREDSMLPEF